MPVEIDGVVLPRAFLHVAVLTEPERVELALRPAVRDMAAVQKLQNLRLVVVERVRSPEERLERPISGFGQSEIPHLHFRLDRLLRHIHIPGGFKEYARLVLSRLDVAGVEHHPHAGYAPRRDRDYVAVLLDERRRHKFILETDERLFINLERIARDELRRLALADDDVLRHEPQIKPRTAQKPGELKAHRLALVARLFELEVRNAQRVLRGQTVGTALLPGRSRPHGIRIVGDEPAETRIEREKIL